MKITESNVIPVALSHYLHVVHGIQLKTKRRKKVKNVTGGIKVFGVSLESLPQYNIAKDTLVPRFLVDACSHLLEHVGTVGLFRKSGSVVRQKALRVRLDRGEACLSTAFPCDVACLLKQFCRELPKPLFSSDLHAALLKAQQLPSPSERTSAIQLLSCLLPGRNTSFLRYILNFLSKVSLRCTENQMSSSNLAVIFAPCLLPPYDTAEGLNGSIHLKAEVVQSLIENAHMFGVIPDFILESVPVLLDMEKDTPAKGRSGTLEEVAALHSPRSPMSSRQRLLSASDLESTSAPRKRQPLRRSLGLETFPNVLVFRSYTPHKGQKSWSPTSLLNRSPSNNCATEERNRQQSIRLQRNESGNIGCFPSILTRVEGDAAWSPLLRGLATLNGTAWRRRSAV